eukprot:365500-Chlamydomonas_euryale.AAC.1
MVQPTACHSQQHGTADSTAQQTAWTPHMQRHSTACRSQQHGTVNMAQPAARHSRQRGRRACRDTKQHGRANNNGAADSTRQPHARRRISSMQKHAQQRPLRHAHKHPARKVWRTAVLCSPVPTADRCYGLARGDWFARVFKGLPGGFKDSPGVVRVRPGGARVRPG